MIPISKSLSQCLAEAYPGRPADATDRAATLILGLRMKLGNGKWMVSLSGGREGRKERWIPACAGMTFLEEGTRGNRH